jgi:cysteine synthase
VKASSANVESPQQLQKSQVLLNASRVGKTPLFHLERFHPALFAKLEYFNPTGSIKDRVALRLLQEAERQGRITPGKSTIVDATSGNFGLSLGVLAGERGYRVIMCIPEDRSPVKRTLMRQYGVVVVLTPKANVMRGSIECARRMSQEFPDVFYTDQFGSPLNVLTHKESTGPELWDDMQGDIDAAFIVAGSGATFCGVTQALKQRKPSIRTFLAQPKGSVFARPGVTPTPWRVEGVGSTFEPPVFDRSLVEEEPLDIPDDVSIATQRELFSLYPFLSLSPCGALAAAAARIVAQREPSLRRIVTIFTEEVTRSVGRFAAPTASEITVGEQLGSWEQFAKSLAT